MPAIIFCQACGGSPDGYTHDDAESGIVPEHPCDCGETAWHIWDVDVSELEGFDDGEFAECPECGDVLDDIDSAEGCCAHCGADL